MARLTGKSYRNFEPYKSSRAFLEPDKDTIDGLEQAIRWAEEEVPSNLLRSMNELVFHMALINQGIARKMSFGPYDPNEENPGRAWKVPVRRIAGAFYVGWKIRRVKPGVWQLFNDSREAYFIEFGINWLGGERRVRRPIRKLSLRRTMEQMMSTQAYHRVWVDIYANPRFGRHRGRGFYQIVQSPAGGHSRWEDVSKHEAVSVIHRNARQGRHSSELRIHGNRLQRRVANRGGGSMAGPLPGRRLPG